MASAKKGDFMNRNICQAACVIAVLASISATVTTIIGFINMAVFRVTEAEPSVGIWCGLMLFVHVILGLTVMATRHRDTVIIYMVLNLVSLGLSIYGTVISYDYWDEFKTFRKYNVLDKCNLTFDQKCECKDDSGMLYSFKTGYTVGNCSMYSFGEDLWLALLVCVITCILWSFIGFIIGLGALLRDIVYKEREASSRHNSVNRNIPPTIQHHPHKQHKGSFGRGNRFM